MAGTVSTLRRELEALHMGEHIRALVATAPPLRPEQRDRLAALLRAPGTSASSVHEAA